MRPITEKVAGRMVLFQSDPSGWGLAEGNQVTASKMPMAGELALALGKMWGDHLQRCAKCEGCNPWDGRTDCWCLRRPRRFLCLIVEVFLI